MEEWDVCMSERLQPDLLARITEGDVRPKDKWRNTELNISLYWPDFLALPL